MASSQWPLFSLLNQVLCNIFLDEFNKNGVYEQNPIPLKNILPDCYLEYICSAAIQTISKL